jgi:Ni,Fe-hydrogenase III small subunit
MLAWIARGLGQGRVTMRYPRGAAPPELAALPPAERPYLAPGRSPLGEQARALRRSIHVRHIDCGSDGSEEWEIQALWNPYYDIQRLGYFLTAAPRHADVLLVTGPVTAAMRAPLLRTWEVMPEPKALVAVGADACSGGLCAADRLTAGGVDRVLAVDVYVPGSPPAPIAIMQGLLLASGLLGAQEAAA